MIKDYNGNYARYCLCTLSALSLLGLGLTAEAATNAWIKSADGKWEEGAAWSLGVVPNSSQSVEIAGSSPRNVTVDASTAANYPLSLSVGELAVSRTNTLYLDNPGTNVPLQISNALRVGSGSTGVIVQNGGRVQAGSVFMYNARYSVTNGSLDTKTMDFIYPATFEQHGGTAKINRINLPAGTYSLRDGVLDATNGIFLTGLYGPARFSQISGTNRTASLSMFPSMGAGGSQMEYRLEGGLLCASNVLIGPRGSFVQSSGIHRVNNSLKIEGSARYYPPQPTPASYINHGYLAARNIEMNEFATFTSSGTNTISESIRFFGSPSYIGSLSVSGGLLSCSDVVNVGGTVDIVQTAGNFVVTNLFSFTGYYPGVYSGTGARFTRFNFSAGTFTANNIELGAEWIIGSSAQAGRITNPGYFRMAGTLRVGDAIEQLGRFIVASNSIVDLGVGNARIGFADSSAEIWNSLAILTVTNWNGALNGGGDDQFKFGSNGSGLTSLQINRIRFVNPSGLATGTYFAMMLSTGEVVPLQPPAPGLQRQANKLVVNCPAEFVLQSSTNVAGPFFDIATGPSSYTNNLTGPQMYFRLRNQ